MAYPITTDYTFDEGIDPTALFGGYASVLLQMIREATPNSYRGMVIYSATTPVVIAPYEWHKRCLWIKPVAGGIELYGFDDTVLHDWVNVFSLTIPAGSIGTTALANGAVTPVKLGVDTGTAYQLLRVNAGATAFEFVNPEDAIAANTLAVTKLVKPATTDMYLGYTGGTIQWIAASSLISAMTDGSISLAKLALGTDGQIIWVNPSTHTLQWVTPTGALFSTGGIAVNKLVPGTAAQALITSGGVSTWGAVDLAGAGVTGLLNLGTQVTGELDLATKVTGVLPVANGGSGTIGCAFRARKTDGDQEIGAVAVKVTFVTEDFDVGTVFASSAFTVPATGKYVVKARATIVAGSTDVFVVEIYDNTAPAVLATSRVSIPNTLTGTLILDEVLSLTAAHDIIIRAYADFLGSGAISDELAMFSAYRLA